MINTKQAKKRIKTAKNIAKITKAMELVAASKMKHAQDQAQASRPYAEKLYEETFLLSQRSKAFSHPFLTTKEKSSGKELILIVAPEKGLCGALVSNLYRQFLKSPASADINKLAFVTMGKKAREIAVKVRGELLAEFSLGLSQPRFEMVLPIAKIITEEFISGRVRRVTALFTHFVNMMTQQPSQKILLPIAFPLRAGEEKSTEYLFEPSAELILDFLLPHYLEIQIYQLLIESFASEQSARMVAMKNATDNALDIIDELTLKYNKARQTGITAEILDIITASLAIAYE